MRPGATAPEALDAGRIELLVWNIYKGGIEGWKEDLASLSGDRNLMLLQEVRLDEKMSHLLADSGLHWQLATAFHYRQARTGVMTVSPAKPSSAPLSRI